MEDKKDEVTVLNTDIEEPQKEEDKQNNKEVKQQDNDDKKKTLKTVITTVICTLLFIIILLLLILLGLKKCARDNSGLSSIEQSSSQVIEEDKDIKDRLLHIVKMQMDDLLMDEDSLTKVVAVSYSDNYPNYYNILTARSESHVYFYTADNVDYLGDKSTYSNIESYLKVDKTDYLNGVVSLYKETITLDEINTSIPKTKLIVSKDDVDNKHISGFYLDNDNKFHVYQRKEGLDSFNDNNSDQIIEQGQPLFEYYQGLNNSI